MVQVVNLLVTPEQAERLSLASNEAKIQLVLRNPLDTAATKTSGVGLAELFSNGAAPAPAAARRSVARAPKPAPPPVAVAPAPAYFVVEVLRGSERADTRFINP
jgi:pilus assembly protein CpaB